MFITLHSMGISVFWPGIVALGFLIGFLSGTFGVGGGFLLIPLLRYVFGIPFEIAIGSSLCVIALSSISGSIIHFRKGNVSVKLALFLLCGSLPGVEIGIRALNYFKYITLQKGDVVASHSFDTVLGICFIILLLFSLVIMVNDLIQHKMSGMKRIQRNLTTYKLDFFFLKMSICKIDKIKNHDMLNGFFIIFFGFLVGLLSGFLGIGGGIIITPVLISLIGLPSVIVIGTSLFQLTITTTVGALLHSMRGNLDYVLIGIIATTSIIGSIIGSRFTTRIRGTKIRVLYVLFLLMSTVFIGVEMMMQH